MRIVYCGRTIMQACEQQLNRMRKNEPDSVELICETRGVIVRTNKGNHYKIEDKNAVLVGGFDECDSERGTDVDKIAS